MSNNASTLPVFTVGFVTGKKISSLGLPVLKLDISENEDDYVIPDCELELIKAALLESLKRGTEPSLTTVSFAVDVPPLPERRRRKRTKGRKPDFSSKSYEAESGRRRQRRKKSNVSNSPQPEQKRRVDTDNHLGIFEMLEELIG